jgi:two-component system chemotaxis response regulator CheY
MARVVIAEDELHILHLVGMWLRRNGHEVIEARNGQAALDAVRALHPDALVTDVNMPVMDGLTVLEHVLGQENRPRAIIMLSSRCNLPTLESSQADCIVLRHPKPFSPSRLLADLEQALRGEARVEPASVAVESREAGGD